MSNTTRVLIAALALLALCVPLARADDDDDYGAPSVSTRSAGSVSDATATLRAKIDPNSSTTTYRFQLGPKTTYGVTTAPGGLSWNLDETTVSVPVTGLAPGTTYNYRAVASNVWGTTYGPNATFKTSGKAPSSGGGNGKNESSGKGKDESSDDTPEVEGEPELGHSVAAAVSKGIVRVRVKGSSEFREIAEGEAIPLNSTFDTTSGTVLLEAAGRLGKTYTGAFHGGQFTVHQTSKGTTTLDLRGGDFSACGSSRKGRATASSAHPVLRKLWGKDHGGRFKTSSRGSVATVRGTEWFTADRCDGTLTRVNKGLVLVRERGTGRSKLLHKGESFFAHVSH